jgi:hypothetical protein
MKKFTVVLAVILFSGFVLIGFKLAARVFPLRQASQTETSLPPPEPYEQSNFLLFQVNDLQIKNPQLIAIWVNLKSTSPTSELFFVSFYPTTSLEKNDQIKSIFSLTRDHQLTASSFRRFKRIFDLAFDGYFVVDNSGLLSLASNASVEQLELISDSPQSLESVALVQKSGKVFLSKICDLLSSGAGNSFFSQVDWITLMPAHFISNKTLDDFQGLIVQDNLSSENKTCNVIIPE